MQLYVVGVFKWGSISHPIITEHLHINLIMSRNFSLVSTTKCRLECRSILT